MSSEAKAASSPPAKKGKGKMILIIVAVIGIGGAAAAGTVLAPMMGGGAAKEASAEKKGGKESGGKGHDEESSEEEEEPAEKGPGPETLALDAIIVDLKDPGGELRHLKVGVAIELGKVIPEEEIKKMTPRARDVAISYLRTLALDQALDPTKYDSIRTEMKNRLKKALGKNIVKRVLFTDYVAQ